MVGFHFLDCTNGTKSRKASHIWEYVFQIVIAALLGSHICKIKIKAATY